VSSTDVVVIGSGATGSLLAARLGAAGRKVVMLEAGPPRELSELYSSTVWSRRLKWRGAPVHVEGGNPVPYPFEAGFGRGGSALHHYACWFRLHREDFKTATLYGKGLDWPIDYEDLRPYYDQLQAEIGISGDADQEVWRPPGEPYPMPPQPVFRQGELIAAGFRRLGGRVAPLPMAINSVQYHGRPACIQDGWCDAGCPTGALANPITIFGDSLARAGVETLYHATAARLITDAAGRRVTIVEYFERDGKRKRLEANLVILAAFAVQTPRLLFNSASRRHPQGLGNSSGLLGRYFMTHGAVNLYGMFSEPTANYLGRTGGQLCSQDNYRKDARVGDVGGYTWRIGSALKLADLGGIANARVDLFGPALDEFIKKAAVHLGTMSALADNLPNPANRVEVTNERDRFGIPLAKVTHTLGEDATRTLAAAVTQGRQILAAAGAKEAWAAPIRTEHLLGGTVMGLDATRSVADGYGRTHDVENLYIAGPGLFPTSGAVNPTFTASALAARTADHIVKLGS
jgi:choline dehydrogenase-like flavoprotein